MTTQTLPAAPPRPSEPTPAPPQSRPPRDWTGPALVALLGATAVLYLWGLGTSGWANSFYSAAAQAGAESWKAFFFGASDAASSITVDKTPLALWPMALSVRVFGLSSWSILVPQAIEGVATVWLLYAVVRRSTGSAVAGLLAGFVMATTPVAVLMFRFDNPDAMLVLLLVGAAGATLRGLDARRAVRWLALAGALVGLAFLAKMLQAFLVLPALGLVYLLFARTLMRKRIGHLAVAFASMLLAGGWWVAIVSLWPASSRPYIGGSQTNSILELTLGYNGLGRITGSETGSVGGGGGQGGAQWGATGLGRLFTSEIGGQAAWLIPAALALGVATLVYARRHRAISAATTLWLTWLVVTGLTFSLMAGIFHPYYTVALAPAVAALVGIGAVTLWQRRRASGVGAVLTLTTMATAVLGFVLLDRTPDYLPWLRWFLLVVGLGSALALLGVRFLPRRTALLAAGLALVAGLAGPTAYAVTTAATPHTGSIPSAGPAGQGNGMRGGPGGFPGGGAPPTGAPTQPTQGTPTQGNAGGLLNGSTSTSAITALLKQDASSYTWVAAAVGSNSAAGYQLASQLPVMAIGGFNGSDPSPTLAQFKTWVSEGKIHWFIASGGGGFGRGGPGAGGSTSSSISSWVEASFTAKTVDGVTLYDLSGGGR